MNEELIVNHEESGFDEISIISVSASETTNGKAGGAIMEGPYWVYECTDIQCMH